MLLSNHDIPNGVSCLGLGGIGAGALRVWARFDTRFGVWTRHPGLPELVQEDG